MLKLKSSVDLLGLSPQAALAAVVAYGVYDANDALPCTITSGTDGPHSRSSLHHVGHAIDLRTRHLEAGEPNAIADDLRSCLGPSWDVVVESDHIHLEWQPQHGTR